MCNDGLCIWGCECTFSNCGTPPRMCVRVQEEQMFTVCTASAAYPTKAAHQLKNK